MLATTILNCNLRKRYKKSNTLSIFEDELANKTVDKTNKITARVVEAGKIYEHAINLVDLVEVGHESLGLRRTMTNFERWSGIIRFDDLSLYYFLSAVP